MSAARLVGALLGLGLAVSPLPGASTDVSFPLTDSVQLTARLCRPKASERAPAIVLMHGCAGDTAYDGLRKVEALLCGSGYVTLVVDSLSARHVSRVCEGQSPTWFERISDALAAKNYLSSLPFVDPRRIGLVGWSHGGSTALLAWARESRERGGEPFAAVAAYYPCCDACSAEAAGPAGSPLLLLLGELDVICPASSCQTLVERWGSGGREISTKIYPGAMHAFDYADPEATRDSQKQLLAHFDAKLKRR